MTEITSSFAAGAVLLQNTFAGPHEYPFVWSGSDDFTGDNGDPPDSEKWIVTGSPDIQNNTLELSKVSSGTAEQVRSKTKLIGDFDVQVSFEIMAGAESQGWGADMFVSIDSTHGVLFRRFYNTSLNDHGFGFWYIDGGAWQQGLYIDASGTTGKLKITRTGSIISGWAYPSGVWVEVDSTDLTSADMDVDLTCQNWTFLPTITWRADDFTGQSQE